MILSSLLALAALHPAACTTPQLALPLCERQETRDDVQVAFNVRNPDASPLTGVRVQLAWEGPNEKPESRTGFTASDGHIDFLVPAGTKITWTAVAPGSEGKGSYGETKSGKWTPPLDRDTAELDVVLRTGNDATFAARFIDAKTKRPLPGVRVERIQGEGTLPWRTVVTPPETPTATGNKDGVVRVKAATWRTCHLLVFADGYPYSLLTVGGRRDAPGMGEVLEVPLEEEVTLQITLVDSTDGMWVRATSCVSAPMLKDDGHEGTFRRQATFNSETTEEEGVHLVRGLGASSYVRLTLMEGQEPGAELEAVHCGAPGSQTKLIFDCWKRGVIGGTLEVSGDRSPAGRTVHLLRQKKSYGLRAIHRGKPLAKTRTDPEGGFRFKGMTVGEYYVFVPENSDPRALPDQVSRPVAVELTPESPRADVEIKEVTGGYLSGTLADTKGVPCQTMVAADAQVRKFGLQSDAQGKFRIGPFHPEDEVRLWASARQGKWAERQSDTAIVHAPMDDIELALNAAGKLELVVAGLPSKGQLQDLEILVNTRLRSYSFAGMVQSDGSFSSGGFAPGEYTLQVRLGTSRKSAPVKIEIREGKITGVIQLELPPR